MSPKDFIFMEGVSFVFFSLKNTRRIYESRTEQEEPTQ